MSFALRQLVNPPTAFLAQRSELGDRFDPEMVLFRRKVRVFKYPAEKLKTFFKEPPQYGAGERGLERDKADQPRYIRITDIDDFGILTNEFGATADRIEPGYFLDEDDLLIARSGNTVGKSYIHKMNYAPDLCFFAGYLIRFRFRSAEMLPDYVFAFTQLPHYKQWVRAVQRAAGQPNINAQEYSNLEIPVAPASVQEKVVSLLRDAYAAKRRQDERAKALLASIDDLMLAELGIPNPPDPPNTLESRMFQRKFSEITGSRFDPLYHHGDLFYFVRNASCGLTRLGPLTDYFMTGFAAGRNDQVDEEGNGIIQIRPTNLSRDRELIFNRNVYISSEERDTRKADLLLKNEVLFNNTNSQEQVGKSVLFDIGGEFFASNHITRVGVVFEKLVPDYLYYVLNLYQRRRVFFRVCTNWNNQSGVGGDLLAKMPIPVPSVQRQREIVATLNLVRTQARSLRAQAQADLEQAKREIEAMILGEPTEAA
jgi:restriction endonuclease S subunit